MRYIKDKWRDFIFIIFLISIVWLLFFLLNKIESLHHTVEQLLDRNYVLLDKNYALESSIKKLYSSQLEKFDINQLENYNDTLYSSLKERVGTGITVVWFIPENFCKDCIDEEYIRLKSLPIDIQKNIIILLNFKRIKDIRLFLLANNFKYHVYNSDESKFDLISESSSGAVFTLDSLLIPKNLFFPISFVEKLTVEYYSFIIDHHSFSNNNQIFDSNKTESD